MREGVPGNPDDALYVRRGERDGKERAMSLEQRLEYLRRAAVRAERDGELRVARALRRMARDIQPIDRSRTLAVDEGAAA